MWEKRFGELVAYKERYGDCNVPQQWSENTKLGTWVANQRSTKKSGQLSRDRVQRFEEIGFDWEPFDAFWKERFKELVAYKERCGDCNVPHRWSENTKLGTWVANQRSAKKSGRPSRDRVRRLEQIGFIWHT